ncbi:uncharacterized protein LOC124921706 [Impatiens glandulifera]|uniref:uncharacterized protein LOC124921706 n=1 Tax=Impatiens glandulifera TaxID=253017 RepID=UPI001FB11507|nr:uncharacterized protein LOC124921706 [Impatiens glandulifera]
MGQVLDKLQGKEWKRRQIRKITDKVFDKLTNDSERATLSFEDLYIAVLLVYNDINKRLPGPHFDPPSKVEVKALIHECDINLDGEIDRVEFGRFVQKLTSNTIVMVSQGLIITMAIAPTVAILTKRATEGVPGVGKVVQRLPNSVYASLVTLAIIVFQNAGRISD